MGEPKSSSPGAGLNQSTKRNTLGVGGQVYELLLMRMNERTDDTEVAPKRVYTRIPFVEPFVRVQIAGDHSSTREMVLACRNLSRGGIGLLHSSFMYPNTPATVFLPRTDGTSPGLHGRVVRVQHRGGLVHEIGIKFDKEINPREYVPGDVTDLVPSFEKVSPERLKGEVLFVLPSEELRTTVKRHLTDTSLRFRFASTVQEAVAETAKPLDMVLVGLEMGETSGAELVKKLRTNGLNCPVALIGTPGEGIERSIVRVCGADAMVPVPLTEDDLLCVLGEFLLSAWDPEQLDKARSRVDRATLVSLCAELNKLGEALDRQVGEGDRVGLCGTSQKIHSLSLLVGMSGVATMAERLANQAADTEAGPSREELIEQVRLGCAAAGRAAAA